MKNKKISISKLLFMISNIVVVAAIIKIIWWTCFPSFWYTPFYKIIEILEAISENYMLTIAISYMIIYLFATKQTKSRNNFLKFVKKLIFIICLIMWGHLTLTLSKDEFNIIEILTGYITIGAVYPEYLVSFVYIIYYLLTNRKTDKTKKVEVGINENQAIANDNQISTSENLLIPNNDKEDNQTTNENKFMKNFIFIICLMILAYFIFALSKIDGSISEILQWGLIICIVVPVFPISFVYIICYLFMNRGNDKTENVEVAINENQAIANDNQVSTNENQAITKDNQVSTNEIQAITKDNQVSTNEIQAIANDNQVSTNENQAIANDNQVRTNENQAIANDNQVSTNENQAIANDNQVSTNENQAIANDNQVSTNEIQAVNNENQISTSENPLIPNNDKEDNKITSENQ